MAFFQQRIKGDLLAVTEDFERQFIQLGESEVVDQKTTEFEGITVCVYNLERYSFLAKNRMALNVTFLAKEKEILITATSAGGSNALFLKINTWSEEGYVGEFAQWYEQFLNRHPQC